MLKFGDKLVKGWAWKKISEIAEINPQPLKADKTIDVTFLGMADISESGVIISPRQKKFLDVSNGFTSFREHDVLVAKITPCFENGKGCLARNLSNGIGFGSTEFHVLRNSNKITPEYLYLLTTTHHFRGVGEKNMTGTAGQKRVATDFLRDYTFPLPPIPEQTAIAELLSIWDSAINKTERLIEAKEKRFTWLIKTLINDQCHRWKHLGSEKIFESVSDRKNHPNEELLSVTQDRGVIPRHMLEGRVMSPDGSTASYKLIKKGDFSISLRSFQGGVEYSGYQGIISPAYTVLRSKLPIHNDFYRHFFKSYIFIEKYLRIAVIGIRDGKQISMPDFKSVKLPYPPIEDQEKVAIVLNAAQKEIGFLKHKLELLKKQKRGLMQKLLTGQWRVKT